MGHKNQGGAPLSQAEKLRQCITIIKQMEQREATLVKQLNETGKQMEKFRRILWAVCHANNGRYEMDMALYKMVMQQTPDETVLKQEPDEKNNKVVFATCDDEGNDRGRIIVPSGFGK